MQSALVLNESRAARLLTLAYGVFAYLCFFATILYAIGFVGSLFVPKSINSGPAAPWTEAILVNGALFALFVVQHTVMARPWFKAWWTQYVPQPAERSTFVLAASGLLALLMWQWRPLPGVVWHVDAAWARAVLTGVSLAGWALVFYSSFVIDHFDLFGLRQVWTHFRGQEYRHPPFAARSVYKYVRHPLMLGFLIAFWATPDMTTGHLIFAGLITAYVLMGIRFEERDLVRFLGDAYARYRERTPMLIPLAKSRRRDA